MILYGIKSNVANEAPGSPTAKSSIESQQAEPEPTFEELREIESIVDVQEKRQYLIKWQDTAEEEWVYEATFLAAVNFSVYDEFFTEL